MLLLLSDNSNIKFAATLYILFLDYPKHHSQSLHGVVALSVPHVVVLPNITELMRFAGLQTLICSRYAKL